MNIMRGRGSAERADGARERVEWRRVGGLNGDDWGTLIRFRAWSIQAAVGVGALSFALSRVLVVIGTRRCLGAIPRFKVLCWRLAFVGQWATRHLGGGKGVSENFSHLLWCIWGAEQVVGRRHDVVS